MVEAPKAIWSNRPRKPGVEEFSPYQPAHTRESIHLLQEKVFTSGLTVLDRIDRTQEDWVGNEILDSHGLS